MARHVTLTRPTTQRKDLSFAGKGRKSGDPLPPLEGGGSPRSRTRRIFGETQAGESDLVEQALALNKSERKALLDRVALSLLESESGRDSGMWAQAVSSALEARLGTGGASAYGPVLAKRIVGVSSAFRPIASFIAEVGIGEMQVTQRQVALNVLAELVVANAARIAQYKDLTLGLNLVATCSANVRAIFDSAFPGYLASGLAKIVFGRELNSSDWDGDREIAQ